MPVVCEYGICVETILFNADNARKSFNSRHDQTIKISTGKQTLLVGFFFLSQTCENKDGEQRIESQLQKWQMSKVTRGRTFSIP